MLKLVIYCYYEKNDMYKNNLKYFIKNGIKDDIDYIFVINGNCTIDIPLENNIKVLYRHNSNYDFGAYEQAIKTININNYKYFFFINTSVRGPFLPPYVNTCWTTPFIDLLKNDVKLVGTTINILDIDPLYSQEAHAFKNLTGYSQPYTHIQTQIFAMDKECLSFLLDKNFFNQKEEKDFVNFIALREILLSQLVLKNKWNISCLIPEYQNIDYRSLKKNINPSSRNGDPNFTNACFNRTFHPYEVIFIKNNRYLLHNETESLTNFFLNN